MEKIGFNPENKPFLFGRKILKNPRNFQKFLSMNFLKTIFNDFKFSLLCIFNEVLYIYLGDIFIIHSKYIQGH